MALFENAANEVEFRCHFGSDEDTYQKLPFLRDSLKRAYTWVDTYYGLEIFKSGQVLRSSESLSRGERRHFLGWKGTDTGAFANIRRELNEEITNGIVGSAIMEWLSEEKRSYRLEEIVPQLEQLGYHRFMSYQGHSLVGRFEPLGLNIKLMHCEMLKWPLLVEIEKIATTESGVSEAERELKELYDLYCLQDYLVKEEPGTLLYERLFGNS
jgi:adenylate cyclase class IV